MEFKTDNRGLFEFSLEEVKESDWNLEFCTFDLHHDEELVKGNVMTEYEEKFSSMGNPICKIGDQTKIEEVRLSGSQKVSDIKAYLAHRYSALI